MSIRIEKNISLKEYNTFRADVKAALFCKIKTIEDIEELLNSGLLKQHRYFILGEGSDVLFVNDFDGLILLDEIKGIDQVYENEDFVWLKVSSGENWHAFVAHCVSKGWGGVENLALIPGTVGAAPVQNIGAYGVEVKDCLHSVEVLDLKSGTLEILMNEELNFGYRWSIFKEEPNKDRYFIVSVTFQLRKKPELHLAYADVAEGMKNKEKSIASVFETIVDIRKRKLPDPSQVPNAGSFFKNPVVSREKRDELLEKFSDLKYYPFGERFKLAAAQLIDKCGWKGKTKNNVGVFANQALVICNFGEAKALDIYHFSLEIQKSVYEKFGVELQPEVNIIT